MNSHDREIEERTRLTSNNKFELLLFRLGEAPHSGERELFGIAWRRISQKPESPCRLRFRKMPTMRGL